MGEYRHTETGEVKSQGEWRGINKNISMPRTWNTNVLEALSLEAVFPSPAATTTQYQTSVRDGVKKDSLGNWVEKYVARDMFADTTEDGVTTTKAEHETAYQKTLDAEIAKNHRSKRNLLLSDSDWTQVSDAPVTASTWAKYRKALRDLPSHANWPNLKDTDWPTIPS